MKYLKGFIAFSVIQMLAAAIAWLSGYDFDHRSVAAAVGFGSSFGAGFYAFALVIDVLNQIEAQE